ncbi:Phytoene dehydrogenase [Brevinematales bacterium NS]|nr:Phytoene dehydrogenase [Brevinematales bacterium NS]
MAKKIVVIGGGYAGLSVAALLAKEGHEVALLEKNTELGGRARVWKTKGYVFDMGPSWYLMPEVFERYFGLFGKKVSDFYELKPLDPLYRIFFHKKEIVDIPANKEGILKAFASLEKEGDRKLVAYLKQAKYKYDIAMNEFLYKEYKNIFSFLNWKMITQGTQLHVFATLDRFVRKYFHDHRARKILEYAMVFLGNSPKNSPALYSIMSHVDLNLGVWYPMGGMGMLVEAMEKLCRQYGVAIHTGEEVTGFEYTGSRITSVRTHKGSYPAEIVVSSADYAHTERELLDSSHQTYSESYWQSRVMAPSMFIMYLGLGKRLKNLTHHNLYFSLDWDKHFDTIFKTPSWPQDPCFYLSCPSKTDPSVAPKGKENLFLLVPIAPGLVDNDEMRHQYADYALKHVEHVIGESITDAIEVKRIFTVSDYANDYHAFKGTALGMAHTLNQTAVFRPAHHSKRVPNLYYTGHYTHPGVGVPMVLIAAEIVSGLIKEEEK